MFKVCAYLPNNLIRYTSTDNYAHAKDLFYYYCDYYIKPLKVEIRYNDNVVYYWDTTCEPLFNEDEEY